MSNYISPTYICWKNFGGYPSSPGAFKAPIWKRTDLVSLIDRMEIKILSLWVRIGLITSLIEWRLLGPLEDKVIVSCLQISAPMLSRSSNQKPWSFFNTISFTNSSFVYSTSVENFCVPIPFLKPDLSWFFVSTHPFL